ncbi:MAG: hypothetical protein R3304_10090 [Longimicrobiales bacterium]|nr:hypothetical protein [Longimicrobiales bacterium]
MKSFAKFAVLGISGIVLFKLLATIILPMFGVLLGLLGLTVKLAILAAVLFFLYSILRKPREEVEVG